MKQIFFAWLPLAVIATILSALIYVAVQQDYRINANDPQIQLAEDISAQLAAGQKPEEAIPQYKTNLAKTLATFIVIYDDNNKPLVSTGLLNGESPVPPSGVFDFTRKTGQDRLTWEPVKGLRYATVVQYFKDKQSGFILTARSLSEVEQRINQLTKLVLAGWLAALVASWIAIVFTNVIASKKG